MEVGSAALSKGAFVISLDVELSWGMIDKPEQLRRNTRYFEQARDCIDKLIALFEKYNISATWAVVGHLFLKECHVLDGQKHPDIPRSKYPWYSKDWFEECPCTNDKDDPLWYGQDIINRITNCKVRQEVACHSFAHIPYGDKNTSRATVKADLSHCISEAERSGLQLESFIFPRNDVGYVDELNCFGFRAYRGKEPMWYKVFPKKLRKACHIIDQLLAICPPVCLPEYDQGLYNIPGSMFYIPMNGFRSLIPIKSRIRKAKKGIRKAIRQKKIFHLWFHPFNIATNQEKLLYGLEEILKEVCTERRDGELETKSMGEIADLMILHHGSVINED